MFKYLLLCFSLFSPMKISWLRNFKTFYSYDNQIVCMVPPLGATSSKIVDNEQSLKEGCEINSEIVHHNDGNTTEIITVTFTKKIKRDKHGNVIKETDTSQRMYQSARNSFFSCSSTKKT